MAQLIDIWLSLRVLPDRILRGLYSRPACRTISCLMLIYLLPAGISGNPMLYNLGKHERMLSAHIYHMLTDRNGYLWMATSQGVVRYNGYEMTTFDISCGLPSNDIWGLHEDGQGRIWVLCFCHALGYIANDEFRQVPITPPPSRLYPRIWNWHDRIMLYNQDGNSAGTIYFETEKMMSGAWFNPVYWAFYDSTRNALFYTTRKNDGPLNCYKATITPGGAVSSLYYSKCVQITQDLFVFDRYLMWTPASEKDRLHVFDMVDTILHIIYLKASDDTTGSRIYNRNRNLLWIYSADSLYQFNEHFQKTGAFMVSPLIRSLPITGILYDSLWGSCFGTAGKGLYISGKTENAIGPPPFYIPPGYRYAGQTSDHTSFWWNQWDKQLLQVSNTGSAVHKQYAPRLNVIKIMPWKETHSLILDQHALYLLNHQTGSFTPFIQGKQLDPQNAPGINEYLTTHTILRNLDLAVGNTNEFFLLTRSGIYRFHEDEDTIRVRHIGSSDSMYRNESYVNITYDHFRKALWAYNNNTILKYDDTGGAQVYKNESQMAPAIRNVEQIMTDTRYGSFFLKEFDRIRVHGRSGQHFSMVYPGINLQKTLACIKDDLLVLAGRFGVMVNKISGYGKLSAPVIYPHVKNLLYNDVYDVQVIGKKIVMTTDKGLFSVPVPDSPDFKSAYTVPPKDYRILLGYGNRLKPLNSGDTVHLDQADMKLRFDVVRPSGNGTIQCSYSLPGAGDKWNTLAGKELLLPALKPGTTTRMLLRFSDDVWISDPVLADLYVTPYWYQTATARRMIWSGIVLVFLGLIATSVGITRRIVVRNNQRRNAHMDIELKALYAQINPHFIFNTLNTALFFIESRKIADAHTHVSRFSHLLRSYIKSSRNRFVTIAEEIENLHNYIRLQQIRFWDKFNYEILVEDGIDTASVRIPALLFQPIVENAIQHGLFHKKEKGLLTIRFKKGMAPQEIICIIEDDGVGRKQSKAFRKSSMLKHESYGLQLTEDLIRILNKYEGMDLRISYQDKEPPLSGTIVTLCIMKAL